jgi:single-strand DNA-binding protein
MTGEDAPRARLAIASGGARRIMPNLNKVMLIGRLTRDPETRHTAGGNSVTNFVEETTFVDVEAWGKTGETFARYMKKGRPAYIEGRLKLDSWEKDGQKRSKLLIVMEEFQFLDSGGGAGGSGGGGGQAASAERRRPAPAAKPAGSGDATPQDDYSQFDSDIPF